MTPRRHYLISYDIASGKEGDKRRNKIFEACLQRGDHAQFSVFFCQLNPREFAELRETFLKTIKPSEDQILIVDLGPAHNALDGGIEYLGRPFLLSTRVTIV